MIMIRVRALGLGSRLVTIHVILSWKLLIATTWSSKEMDNYKFHLEGLSNFVSAVALSCQITIDATSPGMSKWAILRLQPLTRIVLSEIWDF